MISQKLLVVGAAAVFASTALAQEDDTPTVYTYATYMYCDTGDESIADELTMQDAEVLDKLVDDGELLAWGWLGHHTGGQWRRIRYHQADSLEGAFAGLDKIGAALEAKYGDDDSANAAFQAACPKHDDYVWQLESGSSGGSRGKIGFSVYHLCDTMREDRADELVADHVAPILDGMVEDGKLTSWGWQSHIIGGRARKLQTMTAEDLPTLLAARTEAIERVYEDDSAAGMELAEICHAHVDYIWDILHEKP